MADNVLLALASNLTCPSLESPDDSGTFRCDGSLTPDSVWASPANRRLVETGEVVCDRCGTKWKPRLHARSVQFGDAEVLFELERVPTYD